MEVISSPIMETSNGFKFVGEYLHSITANVRFSLALIVVYTRENIHISLDSG